MSLTALTADEIRQALDSLNAARGRGDILYVVPPDSRGYGTFTRKPLHCRPEMRTYRVVGLRTVRALRGQRTVPSKH